MDKPTYKYYKKFNDLDQARDFVKHLEENNIPSILKEINSPLGSSFGTTIPDKNYEISIPSTKIEQADEIARDIARIAIGNIEKDHYLFDFTNEELQEIQNNSNDWSEFDVQLSEHILKERLSGKSSTPSFTAENHTKIDNKTEDDDDPLGKNIWYHIGVIIFLLAASIYYFYSPSLINASELTTIEGKVSGKPYHYTHHDNPEYIRIEVEGQSKPFRIKGCALHSSHRQTLLELDNYDKVKFYVSKEELAEKVRPLISSLVEVYAFSVNEKVYISLEDFNECRKASWKRFLILLPIAGLTMLLGLWKRRSR